MPIWERLFFILWYKTRSSILMAEKSFSKEKLNFFKFASIVHDEFPKMLRSTFVALWNSKIAPLPGYQVWDDSPAVRTLLLKREGGATAIPTNDSFKDWDCTALFKATIYSKTFASSTSTIKTLSDQFIKGKKPSPFHASPVSPTGNQDETITLAIDQIRLLRNQICHLPESSIKKPAFNTYVQLAKDAFIAVKFSTVEIDRIGSLDEAEFPTERVDELNEKIRAVELENHKFLKERVEEGIITLNDSQECVLQELQEMKNVIKNRTSRTECSANDGIRGLAAVGALFPNLSSSDGGIITIKITTEKIHGLKALGVDNITLGEFFLACEETVLTCTKKGFGDERDDQKFGEIKQGCLLVPVHCLTDERFLEVLDDFESGRLKERLLEEFSLIGVEIEGLEIEIKNMEEVNKTKQDIKRRLKESTTRLKEVECQNLDASGNEDVAKMNPHNDSESQIECCIPDKPRIFIGRDALVTEIVSSLVEEEGFGIVNIVGGPGFGKSTVAVKVSHYLKNDHGIVVIFSYLRNASTVSELRLRLCQDFGINPEKDPKFSLMFWVKSVKKKVVLVMDNIEQLLETSDMKSDFTDLLLDLRKNSQQQLRILTTTRTEFSIFGQTKNYQVKVLDEVSSVQLLRECCPDEDMKDAFLSELAKLCGYVPLALCIAGTIIPDPADPLELIQWLREEPMQTLRNSDQCVEHAIEFSFRKLSDVDKKGLICLSVFDGDFQRKSAEEVIEKNGRETQTSLRNLVNRSLVLASKDKRFLIHSLIRRFLADNDQFQDERAMAQRLMVNHFLKMCHTLTIDCYTQSRFTTARKSLKKDIHNVEETLKLCSQNQASNRSLIFELLANSEIYKSLSRFFYNISWDLLPESVLRNFFESCVKLAESRQQPTVGITFQCLVADQEGRKSAWKSPEYNDRMERIRVAFHKYETELRAERSLFEFCYYFLARYDSNISTNTQPPPDLQEADLDYKKLSTIEKASQAYMLMERGNLCKKRATKVLSKSVKYYEHMNCAKSFYNQAIDVLDDHELTCVLHKLLGDLFLDLHKNDDALKCYFRGIELREKLELDSNEAFVFLLKNCGACLYYLGRFEESVEMLKKSRDIADKLSDQDTVCKSRVYFVLAKAYRNWKPDCQEAAKYAKQAMEMRELLDSYIKEKLEKIILTAEENRGKSK